MKPFIHISFLGLLAFSGLFSYMAFLFMLLPLYSLWKESKAGILEKNSFWFYSFACALCFFIVYMIDFKNSPAHLLIVYWKDYFISFDSMTDFLRSFQEVINNLISRWFVERPKWIRMVSRFFIGIGFIYLVIKGWTHLKKKDFKLVCVQDAAFIVLAVSMTLSALKKFPLGVPRMSLFFAPILFLCTVQALEWLKTRQVHVYHVIQYSFLVYLVYVSIGIAGVIFKSQLGAQPVIWQ